LQPSHKSFIQIRIIQYLLFLKGIHYFILYFTPIDDIQAFAVYDDAYMYNAQRKIMQLIFFLMTLLTIYFYERIYLHPNIFVVSFLEDILFRKQSKFFEEKSIKPFNSIVNVAKMDIAFTQVYMITAGKYCS